jgi:hypothetical protein
VNADFKTSAKVNENKRIEDAIREIISKNEGVKQLEFYRAQESKVRLLLKAEGLKKNQNRFYQMNPSKSLKSNLVKKVIIEYPTIFVTMDFCSNDFEIISSDGKTI